MISTHVLDLALGAPAHGLALALEVEAPDGDWQKLASGVTNADGRWAPVFEAHAVLGRLCRLRFETGAHFAAAGRPVFYPFVEVAFSVDGKSAHYHVPLLLSPFGYSTYRGT